MSPSERIRDHQRSSLTRVVTTTYDYAILVRLNVIVCLTGCWIKLKIVSITESEDKGKAVAVEIGCVMPFLCQKGAKDVASGVFYDKNGLLMLL